MNINDEPTKPTVDAQDIAPDTSENQPSQLELIQQWRSTLECLKVDTGFTSVVDPEIGENNEQLVAVLEAVKYLDKKNTLLDENDDFLLSDSGFLKYKTKHLLVFEYLSKLIKPIEKDTKVKFYWLSRNKHIQQQQKPSNWLHSLIHFLFTPVVYIALGIAGLLMVKQTQVNSLVIVMLLWLCFTHFKSARQLLKPFKKTAVTPFKFKVSLLGIHSLNTLLKVCLLCFIPIIATAHFKHYWIDDMVIISLSVLCLFHYKPNNILAEQSPSKESTVEELPNE